MFDAVIFDWDGTLADTRMIVVASFKRSLRELNFEVSAKTVERLIGTGAVETFKQILKTNGMEPEDKLIKKLVEKKIQYQIEMSHKTRLFEGATTLLEALTGKVKLGLASMNNRKVIDCMLDATKTRSFFNYIITADEIKNPKPCPEIFIKCASEIGSAPQDCVVIEDSVFGVKAAKRALMGCVAVLSGAFSQEELEKEEPDLIVQSLKEEAEILDFVFAQ